MPTPYNNVKTALENFSDATFKTKVISEVDAALADTAKLRSQYANRPGDERFKFVVEECWLTAESKADIAKQYKAAGWGDCIVTNSFEDREKPGHVNVLLRAKKSEPRRPAGT